MIPNRLFAAHFTFCCTVALGADAAEPGAFKLVIKNGGMTQGDDVPADWTGKFGEVAVTRDAKVFKEGPAALRVTAGVGKSGQAFQKFDGGASAKLKIAGWMKTQGSVKAQVAVQAFADGFKQNQFIQVKYAAGDGDWAQFEREVALPEWTAFFNVLLMAEGDGSAWLDEVRAGDAPVDAGKAMSPEERMVSGAPPKGSPSEPGCGFYPQFPTAWMSHHGSLLERTKKGSVNVMFFGDSITQGWTDPTGGKAEWDKRFEPLGAANYGIGGDSTRQVLWRIGRGETDGLSPKLIVLKIGTNNLYDDFNAGSDEEIAKGIETIVKTLHDKLPQTKVLLLGILPRQNEYFSGRIARINALAAKLADGKSVRFLDIGSHFATTPGKGDVHEELYVGDKLHLSAKGYSVFAEAIQPPVTEMIAK